MLAPKSPNCQIIPYPAVKQLEKMEAGQMVAVLCVFGCAGHLCAVASGCMVHNENTAAAAILLAA
jgi:hypothetical protein